MTHRCTPLRHLLVPLATLLLLSALASPSIAGVIRHDRSDTLHRELAADPRYEAVGKITWSEGPSSFIGSGTLISPEWVLTAGHVVGGVDDAGGGIANMAIELGGRTYAAEEWIPHPNWTSSSGDLSAGWDIGLVRLSQPVSDIAPALLYGGSDELGRVATTVGFGATGTGLDGYEEGSPGVRRAGQNILDAAGGDAGVAAYAESILLTDFDNPLASSDSVLGGDDPLNLEYMIAPGDSGGGLFIDVDGSTYVAGVNSFGTTTGLLGDRTMDSDYGDVAGFTRISPFVEWIDSYAGALALSALGFSGASTAAVPEPSTLVLCVAGLLLSLFVSRRRRRGLGVDSA